MKRSTFLAVVLVLILQTFAAAKLALPGVFSDHMMLQRGIDLPIWGDATPGAKVTVEFDGQSVIATADEKGKFMVKLAPVDLGKPSTLSIKEEGGDAITIKDVLVGDVWICSGQSNMQWAVKQSADAEKEIAEATDNQIRLFRVPNVTSTQPTRALKGQWLVCSPKTIADFSAVGYFFGREIRSLEKVPVGLIDHSWGGMPAESFASREKLESNPDFKPLLDRKDAANGEAVVAARKKWEKENAEWNDKWMKKDGENEGEKNGWAKSDADEADWKSIELPKHWEDDGLKIDGAVWFRRTVELPKEMIGKPLVVGLGGIDDFDMAYVNGTQVGKNVGDWAVFVSRAYPVSPEMTKDGKIAIAVRVFDRGGPGGFFGPPVSMKLSVKDDDAIKAVSLAGPWKYKVEKGYEQPEKTPARPAEPPNGNSPGLASNIYNAMVLPVIPYAIKGAIWYQGESNAGRAEQYRALFPAMIEDWRAQWKQGDFPFYFVQLANFGMGKPRPEQPADSAWAELREAQTMTLKAVPNAGMAVIIDIGDTADIHPKNKQDVGKRLALAVEKGVYGKADVECCGPMYESMKVDGEKIRVKFSHAAGLAARGGAPKSFAIAGEDQKFHWAEVTIEGDEIVVSSKDVGKPVAVRYAWEDDPKVNLYNAAGLPACPFRTDDWKLSTAGAK